MLLPPPVFGEENQLLLNFMKSKGLSLTGLIIGILTMSAGIGLSNENFLGVFVYVGAIITALFAIRIIWLYTCPHFNKTSENDVERRNQ